MVEWAAFVAMHVEDDGARRDAVRVLHRRCGLVRRRERLRFSTTTRPPGAWLDEAVGHRFESVRWVVEQERRERARRRRDDTRSSRVFPTESYVGCGTATTSSDSSLFSPSPPLRARDLTPEPPGRPTRSELEVEHGHGVVAVARRQLVSVLVPAHLEDACRPGTSSPAAHLGVPDVQRLSRTGGEVLSVG